MYINYDIYAPLTLLVFITHNLFLGSHLLTLESKVDVYYKVFWGTILLKRRGEGGRGAKYCIAVR
jgi:hypothetical protein